MENPNLNNQQLAKRKSKIKTMKVISFVLFALQLLGYLTLKNTDDWSITTWIGFHIWAIIGIILLIRASNLEIKK